MYKLYTNALFMCVDLLTIKSVLYRVVEHTNAALCCKNIYVIIVIIHV